MKEILKSLAITGALLSSISAQAISLDLVPASSSVILGSPVNIALRISGLGDGAAPSLGSYDITLGFNSSILGFGSFTFGDPVLGDQLDLTGFGSVTGADDSVSGELNVFEISLDTSADLNDLQASSFTLGTISFNALAVGNSGLDVLSSLFGDAEGSPLVVATGTGSVEVTHSSNGVPESANSGMFLGICFAGLIACSRVTQRNAARCSTSAE